MYNPHRGIGPAQPPGSSRLNELLDGIRQEFEVQARASGDYEHSSKSSPCGTQRSRRLLNTSTHRTQLTYLLVSQQITEMQMVREKVYQMEQAHLALKQK